MTLHTILIFFNLFTTHLNISLIIKILKNLLQNYRSTLSWHANTYIPLPSGTSQTVVTNYNSIYLSLISGSAYKSNNYSRWTFYFFTLLQLYFYLLDFFFIIIIFIFNTIRVNILYCGQVLTFHVRLEF